MMECCVFKQRRPPVEINCQYLKYYQEILAKKKEKSEPNPCTTTKVKEPQNP